MLLYSNAFKNKQTKKEENLFLITLQTDFIFLTSAGRQNLKTVMRISLGRWEMKEAFVGDVGDTILTVVDVVALNCD